MPTTVKDAEQLMQDELNFKEKMINLFAEAELKMDQFLNMLKEQLEHSKNAVVCTCIYMYMYIYNVHACTYRHVLLIHLIHIHIIHTHKC